MILVLPVPLILDRFKLNNYVIGIILIVVTVIIGSNLFLGNAFVYYYYASYIMSWVGVIISAWCIYSTISYYHKILNPYLIWIVLFILFTNGQPLLYAFGLMDFDNVLSIYRRFDIELIFNAQKYTCISIIAHHLGAIICFGKSNCAKKTYENKNINCRQCL